MTKASSFFGGTNPTDHATKSKYKGNSGSASNGGINISRKATVKQVGTNHGNGMQNAKQFRDPNWSTKSISRPNLAGKEDNRHKSGQKHGH